MFLFSGSVTATVTRGSFHGISLQAFLGLVPDIWLPINLCWLRGAPGSVPRRLHGFRHLKELLIPRVTSEGLDAVAAVALHHGGVIVHDEIYSDIRFYPAFASSRASRWAHQHSHQPGEEAIRDNLRRPLENVLGLPATRLHSVWGRVPQIDIAAAVVVLEWGK